MTKIEQIREIEMLDDQVSENRKGGLENVIEMEEIFLNRIRLAKDARREIGTVFASSGYRVSESNYRLDWGLVELYEDRIGYNKVRFHASPPLCSIANILNKDAKWKDCEGAGV